MIIREATIDDIEGLITLNKEVHDIHVELFPKVFHETKHNELRDWFEYQIQAPDILPLVAEENGELIAYMILRFIERAANEFSNEFKKAYIDQICVTKASRKTGVARALLDRAKDETRKRGFSRIELDFWSKNKNAGSAFEKLGFITYNEKMGMDI